MNVHDSRKHNVWMRKTACSVVFCVSYGIAISGWAANAEPSSLKIADPSLERRLERFEGRSCERVEHLTGIELDPNQSSDPPNPVEFQPTLDAVYEQCGGLGCLEHPDPNHSPTNGICGLPRDAADCAGAADPEFNHGHCGERPSLEPDLSGVRGQRVLATGAFWGTLQKPNDKLHFSSQLSIGLTYQVSLTRSHARLLPDGAVLHDRLPRIYAHLGGFGSQNRVGHELGLLYKFALSVPSRIVVNWMGELRTDLQDDEKLRYATGVQLHIEALNNIMLVGAMLWPVDGKAPYGLIAIRYSAGLWEDFR